MAASIIDMLYQTFQQYRINPEFGGCEHCVSAADSRKLTDTPLRDLSSSDLAFYIAKAMTTWGTEAEFKHFLPRILELMNEDSSNLPDIELIGGKLEYARWGRWPTAERDAISAYFAELWEATIDRPLCEVELGASDSVLCTIGRAKINPKPYLATWLNRDRPFRHVHLAVFIDLNAASVRKSGKLWNSYWNAQAVEHQTVVSWLQSETVHDHVHAMKSGLPPDYQHILGEINSIVHSRQIP